MAMGLIVGDVAVVGLEVQGHGAVGTDGQFIDQLFQVGSMVIIESVGDPWDTAAVGVLMSIRPAEGDGGRVVVQLGELDIELVDGPQYQRGYQRRLFGFEDQVERSAQPIVIETGELFAGQSEVIGHELFQPSRDGKRSHRF